MSTNCNQCLNVVFEALPTRNLGSFQARIHPNEISLSQCVDNRNCHLCTVLHGMLTTRRDFGPTNRQPARLAGKFLDISLWLHYEDDADGI